MRFTPIRKLEIVRPYLDGKDVSQALLNHNISQDELMGWVNRFRRYGFNGLKTTKIQKYS